MLRIGARDPRCFLERSTLHSDRISDPIDRSDIKINAFGAIDDDRGNSVSRRDTRMPNPVEYSALWRPRESPDDSAINSPAHLPLLQSERHRATLFPIAHRGHKGRSRYSPCGGANRCAFRRGDFRNCGDALNGGARSLRHGTHELEEFCHKNQLGENKGGIAVRTLDRASRNTAAAAAAAAAAVLCATRY